MATRKRAKKSTPDKEADEHAAQELVLYIENTSDLSPDGPSGQGRSVLLNALRKWRKGTYDPELGVRLFGYLADTGAKRYQKEFGSDSPIFSPATRREAARQLEESFRSSVENGEYDHVDIRVGGVHEHSGSSRAHSPRYTPFSSERQAHRSAPPDSRAVAFFKKYGGGAVGREEETARELAHAEQEAHARGWRVEWEHDPEGWDSIGDIPPEEINEIFMAVLRDEEGQVLDSLGSIIDPDRNSRRVVEAELALEALSRAS